MADAVLGNAETSALRQDLIAAMVQRELIDEAVLAPGVMDVSQFAEPGAKSIEFPKAGSFTVQKKQEDEEAQAQTVTYATDSLPLDQEAVVQWVLPKRSSLQSRPNLVADTVGRAARAHARQVDVDLRDAMIAGAANTVTLSGSFGREEITEMRKNIRADKFPMSDLTLAISEDFEEAMLNVSDFINADAYGSSQPIQEGEIGKVFGVKVVVSTLLTAAAGARALMWHKESIALGFQSGPDFDSDKDLKNLGTRYSLDQLYGYKVLQAGAGMVKIA